MKAWLTFNLVVTLPSRPEARMKDRGVGMKNGGECSAFYEKGGEFWPLSTSLGIPLTES